MMMLCSEASAINLMFNGYNNIQMTKDSRLRDTSEQWEWGTSAAE